MNRRSAIASLLGSIVGLLTVKKVQATERINGLPVIKSHTANIKSCTACKIENVEEIFNGVPWSQWRLFDWQNDWQETLAWLPKEHAISYNKYGSSTSIFTFWGAVEVSRKRTPKERVCLILPSNDSITKG